MLLLHSPVGYYDLHRTPTPGVLTSLNKDELVEAQLSCLVALRTF